MLKNHLPASVNNAFELMGIAERALERLDDEPEGAFMALCPTPEMSGVDARVYERHVDELVGRMARRGDLSGLTDAEVMLTLHAGSLRHPLETDHAALYEKLFKSVFGTLPFEDDSRESYHGALDELLAQYKRKRVAARAK